MKAKKYKHADLERKRGIFFQLGLIIALAASLAAFEWGSSSTIVANTVIDDPYFEEEEEMPITTRKEEKVELPKPKKFLADIEIVPDVVDVPLEEQDYYTDPFEDIIEIPEMGVEDEVAQTFHIVEQMPEFPGGQSELFRFIASNVRYPAICAEAGIQGRVFVAFVVNKLGDVVEVELVRSPHAKLAEEAMRVVSAMPRWTPGKQRDQAVRVAFTIPVNFVLN